MFQTEDDSDSCGAKRLSKAMSPGSMTLPTMNNWDMNQAMSPYIPPDMNSKYIEIELIFAGTAFIRVFWKYNTNIKTSNLEFLPEYLLNMSLIKQNSIHQWNTKWCYPFTVKFFFIKLCPVSQQIRKLSLPLNDQVTTMCVAIVFFANCDRNYSNQNFIHHAFALLCFAVQLYK